MENNILFFFNSRPLLEIFLKFWQISQNIQRGDPWDFFIIGIFFEILKIFPKYPKGGPLGFFYYWNIFWNFEKISKISKGGTLGIFFLGVPPPKKNFFNAFLDELMIKKKKNAERVWPPPPLWKFPYFFFWTLPLSIF